MDATTHECLMHLARSHILYLRLPLDQDTLDRAHNEYALFHVMFEQLAPTKTVFKTHFMRHARDNWRIHGPPSACWTYGIERMIQKFQQFSISSNAQIEQQLVRAYTLDLIARNVSVREGMGIHTNDPVLQELLQALGHSGNTPLAASSSVVGDGADDDEEDTRIRPFMRTTPCPSKEDACVGHEELDGDMIGDGIPIFLAPAVFNQLCMHIK